MRPISSHMTELARSIMDLLYMWHSTPSCRFVFLVLCLPAFAAKCFFETHQHFCFLWFSFSLTLSVFSFSGSVPENILRKKTFVHPLGHRRNFIAKTKRAIPSGQHRPILPARAANQNKEFAASCPLEDFIYVTHEIEL